MKLSPKLLILLACAAVFVGSPYIPTAVLTLLVGNKISAFLVFGIVLYALSIDSALGIAAFLSIAALFLEQRRRTVEKVAKLNDVKEAPPPFSVEQLDTPAPNIVPGEVHPPSRDAEVDDYSFEPMEQTGTNKYEPGSDEYNEKQPLETVPPRPGDVSEFLQAKGLANINSA
jgi:hypothetical protein